MTLTVETGDRQQDLTVSAAESELRVSELLRRKHLPLNTRCGQRGLCDGCMVELIEGALVQLQTGQRVESLAPTPPTSLRGCEYRLAETGTVRLRIPARSLLAYEPQVVSNFKLRIPHAHDPLWQQVEIPLGTFTAGHTVEETLCREVATRCKRRRPVRLAPELVGQASRLSAASLTQRQPGAALLVTTEYREDHWLITEITTERRNQPVGIAIDIGTTTVAVLVVDLTNGQVLSSAANFNKQMHLADDVLSRINLCSTDPAQVSHLQRLIVEETLAPLILEALTSAGLRPEQVHCLTAAANTTMLHLFAGIDPSPMGVAPFTPVFLDHKILHAERLPFSAEPPALLTGPVHLLPSAAAYVGADLTAGALATGLMYDDGPSLLVDVGTNGEIILKYKHHLYGCATAAGPAFEGAGLTNGVRAAAGAISHIELQKEPFTVTNELIGKHTPIGICGTAYIDFLAQARQIGLLTPAGRIDSSAVDDRDGRIVPFKEYGLALRVAYGPGRTDILITETDIANLLQAKGAIAAGILTLLQQIGMTPADIRTLYLAGGFGLHLKPEHAIGCGLLPGFRPEQIEVVGNTSLAGAYVGLLDCGALDEIAKCGRQMEVIELNLDPGFEDRYIEQLSLP